MLRNLTGLFYSQHITQHVQDLLLTSVKQENVVALWCVHTTTLMTFPINCFPLCFQLAWSRGEILVGDRGQKWSSCRFIDQTRCYLPAEHTLLVGGSTGLGTVPGFCRLSSSPSPEPTRTDAGCTLTLLCVLVDSHLIWLSLIPPPSLLPKYLSCNFRLRKWTQRQQPYTDPQLHKIKSP